MKTDALWINFDNGICDLTFFFFYKSYKNKYDNTFFSHTFMTSFNSNILATKPASVN